MMDEWYRVAVPRLSLCHGRQRKRQASLALHGSSAVLPDTKHGIPKAIPAPRSLADQDAAWPPVRLKGFRNSKARPVIPAIFCAPGIPVHGICKTSKQSTSLSRHFRASLGALPTPIHSLHRAQVQAFATLPTSWLTSLPHACRPSVRASRLR